MEVFHETIYVSFPFIVNVLECYGICRRGGNKPSYPSGG